MDIFFLLLMGMALFKVKFEKSGFNDDYLSGAYTKNMRGFFAITIVLHHIYIEISKGVTYPDIGYVYPGFGYMGYTAVGIFFLLSGYGLMISYINKKNYLDDFLKRRLGSICIPYVFAFFIYYFGKHLLKASYDKSFTDCLFSLVNGSPSVTYSWYVIAIFLFYLIFYIFALVIKKPKFILLAVTVFSCVYILFGIVIEWGSWWYGSCLCFPLGIFWAIFHEKITAFIKKNYLICFILSLILTGLFLKIQYEYVFSEGAAIFFCISVFILNMKLRISNKLLSFLGGISFEIYLYHGLSMLIFRSDIINIENNILYAFCVCSGVILIAYIMNKAYKLISNSRKVKKCQN